MAGEPIAVPGGEAGRDVVLQGLPGRSLGHREQVHRAAVPARSNRRWWKWASMSMQSVSGLCSTITNSPCVELGACHHGAEPSACLRLLIGVIQEESEGLTLLLAL